MLRIKQASEHLGVKVGTLRKWTNEGRIKFSTTQSGQRVFSIEDLQATTGKIQKDRTKVICYCRVSSVKQKNDLVRQCDYIKTNIPDKYSRSECLLFTDVASGLNFKRQGLLRLLERIQQRDVSTVIVASKDRLSRFGYELIEWMCLQYGTEILVLNNKDSAPETELGEDLLAIVQVYCCRWNGKRRYEGNKSNESTQIETESNT
jgi:excisionase family DNA binding protein